MRIHDIRITDHCLVQPLKALLDAAVAFGAYENNSWAVPILRSVQERMLDCIMNIYHQALSSPGSEKPPCYHRLQSLMYAYSIGKSPKRGTSNFDLLIQGLEATTLSIIQIMNPTGEYRHNTASSDAHTPYIIMFLAQFHMQELQ